MKGAPSFQAKATQLVDDLVAAGARFTFKPAVGSLPASFTYELDRGADRWRCRAIVAEGRADAQVWHELVAEVGRRCNGGAK